ncbi:hypothetical protein H7Y21_02510, partial [Arenimonas sp.]|nr:hypothetical protein [Candidatus Parcubacteria bacterium]
MQKNLIILILLLAIAGGIAFYLQHSVILVRPANENATTSIVTGTPDQEIISASTSMKIKVALLGAQMETSNKDNFRGCDVIDLQERTVPISTMPLNAALRELFSKKDIWMPSELAPGNFISSQKELFFDNVSTENGTAKIYLLGKIGPLNGVCDDPRLRIQLEETA